MEPGAQLMEERLQVAVRRHGRLVADVAVGLADPQTGASVQSGTLFFVASAAKGVAAALAHVLTERGDVGYDLRLADVRVDAKLAQQPVHDHLEMQLMRPLLDVQTMPGKGQRRRVSDCLSERLPVWSE